ncbi:MAG: hypothetical protein RLZZ187_3578 [Pseudomonadota bacterium]
MDSMTDAAMPPGFDPRTTMVPAPWPLAWPLPWGPWLQLTQSAFDAWMGLWTAALPQQQAELVLQVQRQALDAWTAPLALAAPPPEPRRPMPAVPMARPASTPRPEAAVRAAPEPDVDATVSAEPVAAARPERAPPRPRKAAAPVAELRQARSRKTVPPQRTPRPKTRR